MTTPSLTRRGFLAGTLATGVVGATGTRFALATPANPAKGDTIVCVFLRGGMDGLSAVVPFTDGAYYDNRPLSAVAPPGATYGALPLSDAFGLHPAMTTLHAGAWAAGNMAVIPAVGLGDSDTRSHFDAEIHWEQGGRLANDGWGWLGRYVAQAGATGPVPAVGRGPSLQRALRGHPGALAMTDIDDFGLYDFPWQTRNASRDALTAMYPPGGANGSLEQNATNTLQAYREIESANPGSIPSEAAYPQIWERWNFIEAAQLIKADLGVQGVCIDVHNWDHHDSLGTPSGGVFRDRITVLDGLLSAFMADLGPRMAETTIVVMSEFGRTIEESGEGGTDHGRGGAMFVLGNNVAGGIYGTEGFAVAHDPVHGDIPILTDCRTVLSEVIRKRSDVADPAALVAGVFPSFSHPIGNELGVIA